MSLNKVGVNNGIIIGSNINIDIAQRGVESRLKYNTSTACWSTESKAVPKLSQTDSFFSMTSWDLLVPPSCSLARVFKLRHSTSTLPNMVTADVAATM
jgi:hypothetical protein